MDLNLRFNSNSGKYTETTKQFEDNKEIYTDDETVETQDVDGDVDVEADIEIPDEITDDASNMSESRYNIGAALSGIHSDINMDDFTPNQDPIELSDVSYHGTGIKEKNLDNMSRSELILERSFAQTQLEEKRNLLDSINNDTNPVLKNLKKDVEETNKIYKEQIKFVDKEQINQRQYFEQKLDNKKIEINQKNYEISGKKREISSREDIYENISESIEMLEDGISEIEGKKDSPYKKYAGMLKRQLDRAIQEEKIAKLAVEYSKKELEILNAEEEKLEKEQKEINQKKNDLEKKIAADNQKLQEMFNKYNKAKETLEKEKNSAINIAENEVNQAQNYLKKVENALADENNKNIDNEFDTQKIPEDLAKKLKEKYGDNYEQELQDLSLTLNCSIEKLIQILTMEY